MAALITALGTGPTAVVGHSMGAWVTALAAVRHPELVRRVLLVDGALTFPLPEGIREEDALAAVLGPALARLSMTFPDRDAYREFWQRHPAFGAAWSAEIDAYTQRDLVGVEPELRSSCVLEAVQTDGAQVLLDQDAATAVHRLPCPAELLWAERGLLDEPQGLYDHQRIGLAGLDRGGCRPRSCRTPTTTRSSGESRGPSASSAACSRTSPLRGNGPGPDDGGRRGPSTPPAAPVSFCPARSARLSPRRRGRSPNRRSAPGRR